MTGVPEENIITAARLYAASKRATILYAMGITQHTSGTINVASLANLAMLTGNVGRPSTGIYPSGVKTTSREPVIWGSTRLPSRLPTG